MTPLLEIRDLKVDFRTAGGSVRAVDGVSIKVQPGETFCLVGESGSGKSVTALSIARLLPSPPAIYSGGEVLVEGQNVLRMSRSALQSLRGGVVSYIFQEPSASLNPVFRVGYQILESLKLHKPKTANASEVTRLLKLVGISAPEQRQHAYPHQLSGGMQQRVMIAMAIASEPRLLIADEPTTALDVTIQAQIIDLLKGLKARLGMGMLWITHNLALVSQIADHIAVMYAGQVVETGPARELLANPLHPYTRALIASVPRLRAGADKLRVIQGNVPVPGGFPSGCRFHPRCPIRRPVCSDAVPELEDVTPGRSVRCPFWANQDAGAFQDVATLSATHSNHAR